MKMSCEDRELLKKFFEKIEIMSSNHHLMYIENIDFFREILHEYILQNRLEENIIFNLFLNEVRHDELIYKLNKDNKEKSLKNLLILNKNDDKFSISCTIKKWHEESNLEFFNDDNELHKSLIKSHKNYIDMMNKIIK